MKNETPEQSLIRFKKNFSLILRLIPTKYLLEVVDFGINWEQSRVKKEQIREKKKIL